VNGALLGLIALLLLTATGLLVSLTLGIRNVAELLLATYITGFTGGVALFLFLSAFNAVTRGALLAGLVAFLVGAAGAWLLGGAERMRRPRLNLRGAFSRHGPLLLLAVSVALGLGYVIALILGTPPNGWDPMNYHLARAAFWLQSGGVGYIGAAYDERLNFNPPNGEIAFAFGFDVTRDETLVGFVQFFAALACTVAVYALARRFGLSRAEGAFGSLLFVSLPIVVLQSSGAKNDVIVASFLLAGTVFVLGDRHRELALAGLAAALAVGTKFTAAYGLVVLLVAAIVALPRTRRVARIVALALGTCAGSYWYAVNAHETHHLLGDQSNVPGLTAPFHARENLLTAYGMIVDALDLSGAPGADIFIYAIAALALGIGLTVVGRLGRGSTRRDVLAGALVAVPPLLLVVSKELGRPGLVRLYDALGEPKGYLADGDATASSPTAASDTGSWFGPVGFLLVIGIGITAVLLARRRSISRTAFTAALAPFLWFALVALTLTYNPWLGRFFVYPVALSAALWGLTLRARAAAWGLATLAAVTLGLTLVHYVEKPSGVRLLDRTATVSVWSEERWQVQSQHDPPIGPVFRFLDEDVPEESSIALALGANDFGYPPFGPHLERRVDLVPFGSSARDFSDDWLVATRERSGEIDPSCWRPAYEASEGAVFKRATACDEQSGSR
jgi:dolichyl-phosphate-mannose-protein mannosyltransferase